MMISLNALAASVILVLLKEAMQSFPVLQSKRVTVASTLRIGCDPFYFDKSESMLSCPFSVISLT